MRNKPKGTISRDEFDWVAKYIFEHGGFPGDADKKEEAEMSEKHEFESSDLSSLNGRVQQLTELISYTCALGNKVLLLEVEADRIRRNIDSLIYDVRCASVVYGGLFFLVAVYMVVRELL